MTRLLRVELSRYFSRRAIVLLLIAVAVVTGLFAARTIWDTRPATAEEMSTAQAQADVAASEPNMLAELSECKKDPASYLGPQTDAADCTRELVPSARSLLPREPLHLAQVAGGDSLRVVVLLLGVVLIAAATYAGADWRSGSIATQLTFRPDRIRLWVAKGLVVMLASGVVTAVVLAGYWAAMLVAADSRGITVSAHLVSTIGWQGLRAVALVIGGGLGSYALTMLFRHTVATLALLFAYAAGGEVLINLLPIHGAARWSVGNNVYGWLKDGFSYVDPSAGCRAFSNCDAMHRLGHGGAAAVLGSLLVVAVVVSLLTFRRRDI